VALPPRIRRQPFVIAPFLRQGLPNQQSLNRFALNQVRGSSRFSIRKTPQTALPPHGRAANGVLGGKVVSTVTAWKLPVFGRRIDFHSLDALG
jgi:hypothetical protein